MGDRRVYPPLLWEGLRYQLPPETLDKKHSHSACCCLTCLLGTIAGRSYLLPWKSAPLPIYYLCLSTCPKLSGLFYLAPARHLWQPGHRPSLPRSYMVAVSLFLQSMAEKPFFFPAFAFSSWDLEVPLVPSAQQLGPGLLY